MKSFFEKDWVVALINVAVLAISAVLMLSGVPSAAVQGPGGWLIVRGIVFVWSVIMAIGIYSKWYYFGTAIKELIADIKNVKKDATDSTGDTGKEWVNSFLDKVPLLGWVVTWVVLCQIMASFYVADWCIGGF